MIVTSYYSKLKHIYEKYGYLNVKAYSISLWQPYGMTLNSIDELKPNTGLFAKFKSKAIDKNRYIKEFNNQLDNVDLKSIYKQIDDKNKLIVLLCFEKSASFCHRHIVAERFRKLGLECKEFE